MEQQQRIEPRKYYYSYMTEQYYYLGSNEWIESKRNSEEITDRLIETNGIIIGYNVDSARFTLTRMMHDQNGRACT